MANDNSSSHFFVDYTALDINPVTSDAFGPVEGSLTTKYKTTSFVNSSGTGKVFAICKGRVLILPHAENNQKVNLILKPESSFGRLKVKYFIYRNVDKGDLIAGTFLKEVDENDPNQPAFLKRMWKEYIDFNMPFYLNGTIPDPPDVFPAAFIGYNENPDNISLDKIFNGEGIIGEPYFQLPMSKMGEHLANFSEQIGLDVVLDYGDYQLINEEELFHLDINYARKAEHIFDISADIGTAPDPITIKRYREHILQFMDAAAFWGSFIPNGSVSTISDAEPLSTPSEIGTKILTKFFTKNKVYLYIQGEHERTYNYFDTSRKVYGFEVDGELAQTNGWPILIKEISFTSDSQTSDVKLEYEIENYNVPPDHDEIPVIQRQIILDVVAGNSNPLDSYPKIYRPEDDSGQTDSIKIKFYGDSTKSYSTFVFIYANLKQKYPVENYFNSLWTINIDTPYSAPDSDNAVYYANYNRNRLVNLDDTMGVGANIQNKVVFDNGLNGTTQTRKKRRLYMAIVQANSSHDAEHKSYNVTEITAGKIRKITRKEDYANLLYNDQDFAVYRGSFYEPITTDNVQSLSLVHHKNFLKQNSYYHLGITDEEYNKLIYNDPAPISTTPQYLPTNAQKVQFYLNEITTFTHENIRKFELGLWYEDNTGVRITTAKYPTGTNKVYVYTMDGYFFFSKEYSDHQEFYNEFANTIVEFRTVPNSAINPPAPAYNGEFGFDWLRINDNPMDTRPTYENSILSGYERPHNNDLNTEYENKVEAYKALKREYKSIPTRGINQQYFIPYLNLFSEVFSNTISTVPAPAFEVYLRVYVDIKANINKLEFDYDTNLFEIDKPVLSDKTPSTTGNKVESLDKTIKIKCLNDFSSFQQIRILEYPQGINNKNEAQLAGLIIMNKNNSLSRKELNFVYVKVMTNVDGSGNQTGSEYTDEVAKLINSISHSSVICKIESAPQILDLSANLDYQIGGTFVDSQTNGLNEDTPNFFTNLTTLFLNDKDQAGNLVNSKYSSNYFTIFCFGYDAYDLAAGQIESIGKHNLILFPSRGNATLAHEGMHGLGLFHTHRDGAITNPNQKFTFYKYNSNSQNPPVYIDEATDNYMSYAGNLRKTTWHWQWKIVRKNI